MAPERLSQRIKPYVAMVALQFGYAGTYVLTKMSLNQGTSNYVLLVYRHAFAAATMAPFALVLERNTRPRMTFTTFTLIFAMGLLGPVLDQNFYYAGLKFTSATFACAMINILPVMTFVMAVLCRMEKVDVRKMMHQAKVIGTLVTVAGTMLMTLYKGPMVRILPSGHVHSRGSAKSSAADSTYKDSVKGPIFIILSTVAWAALFIVQTYTLQRYSAPLSVTTLICFLGTLLSIVVTLFMERDRSAWNIGFDMNLLAAASSGIIASGMAYYIQGIVIAKRGPVFASAFSPLVMIISAVMGALILAEKTYLGGILGAILMVIGLYSVLWGKHKEKQEMRQAKLAQEIPLSVTGEGGADTGAYIDRPPTDPPATTHQ